jgi:hypothetical protein
LCETAQISSHLGNHTTASPRLWDGGCLIDPENHLQDMTQVIRQIYLSTLVTGEFFMQIKSLAIAVALMASSAAFATTQVSSPILLSSGSFSDKTLDTLTISAASDVTGSFSWGTGNILLHTAFGDFNAPLVAGTVSGFKLGSLTDQDGNATNSSFAFHNVAAGTYNLTFTGSTSGLSMAQASSTMNAVAAVPEPETYAMMLAGLGALGFVGRRRKAQAK